MHDDVHVAPQFRQAVHEFALGYPAKLTPQDLRQLWLWHAQDVRGLRLSEALLYENLGDLGDELRL